jgi:hypothetical protein
VSKQPPKAPLVGRCVICHKSIGGREICQDCRWDVLEMFGETERAPSGPMTRREAIAANFVEAAVKARARHGG